jgi:hypothetical protein
MCVRQADGTNLKKREKEDERRKKEAMKRRDRFRKKEILRE